MNEIAKMALRRWALFCVNHSNEQDAIKILYKVFEDALANHFLGRMQSHDWNWNELVISLDEENTEALFSYILTNF